MKWTYTLPHCPNSEYCIENPDIFLSYDCILLLQTATNYLCPCSRYKLQLFYCISFVLNLMVFKICKMAHVYTYKISGLQYFYWFMFSCLQWPYMYMFSCLRWWGARYSILPMVRSTSKSFASRTGSGTLLGDPDHVFLRLARSAIKKTKIL